MPSWCRAVTLLDPVLACELFIAIAAVEQMPLHGVTRLRYCVRTDRMQDLLVLALEDFEMRTIGRRRRRAPHLAPRDDEAPEIFQKALELLIARGVGDGAMEREIL